MKTILLFFILLVGLVLPVKGMTESTLVSRDSLVSFAKSHIGTPYVYGGSTERGFDCSGFVYYVFKKFGITVSRTSRGFSDYPKKTEITGAKTGDVIAFTGTNSAIRKIGHVGIVIQNNDGVIDFIHSSSSKKHFGVTVTRFNESGYLKRFLTIIKILQ
jgi:cell wall-associated NlpC family hydrolase